MELAAVVTAFLKSEMKADGCAGSGSILDSNEFSAHAAGGKPYRGTPWVPA